MRRFFLPFLLLLASPVLAADPPGTRWQSQAIGEHAAASPVSLALDAKGLPRIAFGGFTGGGKAPIQYCARYAQWDGKAWKVQTVANTKQWPRACTLALDSKGTPHIAFSDYVTPDIRYATLDKDAFRESKVGDGGPLVGVDAGALSIAVGPDDRPIIAIRRFVQINVSHLIAAVWTGQKWDLQTLDDKGVAGDCSLAIAKDGTRYITYVRQFGSAAALRLATWDGKQWQTEEVAALPGLLPHHAGCSITLDRQSQPRIAYNSGRSVCYVERDKRGWRRLQIEQADDRNFYGTSLALDAAGHPTVAYSAGGSFRYATFDGRAWTIETIGARHFGQYPSLAFSPKGVPLIAHSDYSQTNSTLTLTTRE